MGGRTPVPPIVKVGNELKNEGLRVGENAAFGGIQSKHKGRGHYDGRAIDVNIGKGREEASNPADRARFDEVAKRYSQAGYMVIWRGYYWENGKPAREAEGHYDHIHIEQPRNGKVQPVTPSDDGGSQPNVPSGPAFSIANQQMLRVGFDRDQEFYPNYLNDFHNVAYNIKFFMVDPQTFSGLVGDKVADSTKVAAALDQAPKVVIAQTGVTTAINIKSMSYKAIPDTDPDNMDELTFQMTLVEPLGTSFYDVTVNGSNYLGIESFQDSPYFIEVSFKGYDEEGRILENVLLDHAPMLENGTTGPKFTNEGRWFFQVFIKTVDTQITPEGATHELELVQIPAGAIGQDGKLVPVAITATGETIGEIVKSFEEALDKAQDERYPVGEGRQFDFQFVFESTPEVTEPIESWTLRDDGGKDWLFTDASNLTMEGRSNGKPVLQVAPNSSIPTLLKLLCANTDEGQRYGINGSTIDNETSTGSAQARAQIIIDVSLGVQILPEVTSHGMHRKVFTYTIRPKYYNSAVVGAKELEESKSPEVQKEMIAKLREKGYLRKRFDYFYTGTNTEIINFDVKFQMYWGAILGNVISYGVSRNAIQHGAHYNEDAVRTMAQIKEEHEKNVAAKAAAVTEYHAKYNEATGGLAAQEERSKGGTLFNEDGTPKYVPPGLTGKAKEEFLAAQAKAIQAHRRVEDSARRFREADRKLKPQERDKPALGNDTVYAEDLTESIDSPMTVPMVQAVAGKGDTLGAGMSEPYHRNRSVFGKLMEQLLGEQGTLMTIEMEIRGDPYWMGSGNISKKLLPNEEPSVAAYDWGGVIFFLKVAYPFQASATVDGTERFNGNPNFRTADLSDGTQTREDMFTGFYQVQQVENVFSEGQFRQRLTAFRHPMLKLAQQLGEYGSVEGESWRDDYLSKNYSEGGGGVGESGGDSFTPSAPLPEGVEERASLLYKKLKAQGYSDVQIAAILGTFQQESGLNPNIKNGIGAYGLAQWLDRRPALMQFARDRGLNPADIDTQLAFFQHEMNSTESAAGKKLRAATSLNEAMAAMNQFERFKGWQSGPNGAETGNRYGYMQSHYDNILGGKYG